MPLIQLQKTLDTCFSTLEKVKELVIYIHLYAENERGRQGFWGGP